MATTRQQALRMEIFNLALFLHPNITEAQAVTLNACEKYEKADELRYRRTKNSKKEKSYRAALSDRQLAQQMVYEASEQFLLQATEIQALAVPRYALPGNGVASAETGTGVLSLDTAIIHFLKFLALITTRRNALYVAVGFCQVLRSFSTDAAALILETLKPEDEHLWLESQCRNIKSKLVKELCARFAFSLGTGAHGAVHFVSLPNAETYRPLVQDCLMRLVPWGTSHLTSAFAPLASEAEIFHALLEPECFKRVLAQLQLPPDQHFELPWFPAAGWPGGTGSFTDPTAMAWAELQRSSMNQLPFEKSRWRERLQESLQLRAQARRQLVPETLRIAVNGSLVACLNLQTTTELTLTLEDSDRLLEVYAPGVPADLLLAVLPLACAETGGLAALSATTKAPHGGRFSFVVTPLESGDDSLPLRASVRVKYHPSWRTQWKLWGTIEWGRNQGLLPGLALLAMMLLALLIWPLVQGLVTGVVKTSPTMTSAAAIWQLMQGPVSATHLVQQSIAAEQATVAQGGAQRVIERKVRLEVCVPNETKPTQTYYLTTWTEAQRSVRLLTQDAGARHPLSGEWQHVDGSTSLYSMPRANQPLLNSPPSSPADLVWPLLTPSVPSASQTPFSQRAFTSTGLELWRLSPDAVDFQTLLGLLDHATVTETATGWEIQAVPVAPPSPSFLLTAVLQLNRAYHPIRMNLTLRAGTGTREFRFTEEALEKRPLAELENVFTPGPEWLLTPSAPPTQPVRVPVAGNSNPTIPLPTGVESAFLAAVRERQRRPYRLGEGEGVGGEVEARPTLQGRAPARPAPLPQVAGAFRSSSFILIRTALPAERRAVQAGGFGFGPCAMTPAENEQQHALSAVATTGPSPLLLLYQERGAPRKADHQYFRLIGT